MSAQKTAKSFAPPRAIVGVIADRAALICALRLRRPPDFFELRLDALGNSLGGIEAALSSLGAPLIFTARDPSEGGTGNLSLKTRRNLIASFLPLAAWLDIELRRAKDFQSLSAEARERKVRLILSLHDLRDTPSLGEMSRALTHARNLGADIFKIATRTETRDQLVRLTSFFLAHRHEFPIAAMGLGELGSESRREFFRHGSVLNYAAVGAANAPGQLSLAQLRRIRAAYI